LKTPRLIGLTGGIATGKSTFLGLFAPRLGAQWFCADACVRELLDSDPQVAGEIRARIDPRACRDDGSPDRAYLRELIFGDASVRWRLEEILHPRVRARWTAQAVEARAAGKVFVVDIPLLFETGAEGFFEAVVVVACSREVQTRRLLARRGIDPAMAKKMIDSQRPMDSKIESSHHVVWNDGDLEALRLQSDSLARIFDVPSG
jgi:dephospho-CoA kinase